MRVPDLSKMAEVAPKEIPLSEVPEHVRVEAEIEAGMRCGGCRRRITVGFAFTRAVAVKTQRASALRLETTYACARDDCDHSLGAAVDSFAMRPVEYAFLDEKPEEVEPE